MYYEKQIQGQQIHALVVGVGSYPSGKKVGFSDLDSPPVSALRFADWLIDRLRHPTASIATVDLLVSPTPSSLQKPDKVSNATFAKFKDAVSAWANRCSSSEGNIGIFYFCGHGVESSGELSLLFEEFGSDQNNVFAHALNWDQNYKGLARFAKGDFYFFVDCCRKAPLGFNVYEEYDSQVIFSPKVGVNYPGDAAVFLATGPDEEAYGPKFGVARFTSALIEALEGLGADYDSSNATVEWVVNTNSLAKAIATILEWENLIPGVPKQSPDRGRGGSLIGSVLHRFDLNTSEPSIKLSVVANPPNMEIEIAAPNPPFTFPPYSCPQPVTWPWETRVRLLNPNDLYLVRATVDGAPVKVNPERLGLHPPFTRTNINIAT